MIKRDIVRRLGETTACYKLTQKEINDVVTEVFKIMSEAFVQGEEIQIRGFGHFHVKYRKPRKINHPSTKQIIQSHPKYMVSFDPSKDLKQKLHITDTKGVNL